MDSCKELWRETCNTWISTRCNERRGNDACLPRRLEWFGQHLQALGHGNTFKLVVILLRAERDGATHATSEPVNETIYGDGNPKL